VVGKYDSIQDATSKGYQAPSAFLDDVKGESLPYLYATAGSLMVARTRLNGGTAPLSFSKWYVDGQGKGSFSEAGIGGNDTPMSFLPPPPPSGQGSNVLAPAQYCEDPAQERTMGSISYLEDMHQYLLTFVCISKSGDPQKPDGQPGAAWFYSTNADLSHQDQWSFPRGIAGSWSPFTPNSAGCQDYQGWYPSFMSLDSPEHHLPPGHLTTTGYVFYLSGCAGGGDPPPGRRFETRVFTIN
jgi:hypothetical protein